MNRRKLIFSIITLSLIAGTALLLAAVPQRLGLPGVKTTPIPGSTRCEIYLPETILGGSSTNEAEDPKSLGMLPADTSFAERVYHHPGAFPVTSSVVLMGTDRTSVHKAEYCLQGQGWHIDEITNDVVHIDQARPYDLPVIKIVATQSLAIKDKTITARCVYVYWYVADGVLSNDRSGFTRMWLMARQLALTGVLQRWAYVRFYTFCEPGQEDAAYGQIKEMIAASVPQFQIAPEPSSALMAGQPAQR